MSDSGAIRTGWRRLRRLLFGKGSLWGLLPVAVALVGSAALNVSDTRALANTRELVAHSLRVDTAINAVLSAMQDVEVGQRGYLITGDPAYLAPYVQATAQLPGRLDVLGDLVRDNGDQGARLARARTLAAAKLAEVAPTIRAMASDGFPAARALVANDEGKRTMDAFRAVIGDMRTAEGALLEARMAAMRDTERRLYMVVGAGITLALTARLAAFLLKLRARQRRRQRAGAAPAGVE